MIRVTNRDDLLDEIERRVDELTKEHHSIPSGWFGTPKRRHDEIMGAVRELRQLHKKIAFNTIKAN